MRLLNQMLNLSRIFDCFSCRFGKDVFTALFTNMQILKKELRFSLPSIILTDLLGNKERFPFNPKFP